MTMPWNKHSSTWEVPWDDRWENRKIVTVKNKNNVTSKFIGNPKDVTEGTILKIEDDMEATVLAAIIPVIFWGILLCLFFNFVPGLYV